MTKPKRPTRTQMARIVRYWDFTLRVVAPFQQRYPQYRDDLRDAAIDALFGCAGRYDLSFGTKFETYVRHRIRGAVKDKLAEIGRRRERNDEIAILFLVSRERPIGADLEEAESFERLLETFTEEDRALLIERVLGGLSFERIAKKIGVPATTLRDRLKRAAARVAAQTDPERGRGSGRGRGCTCSRASS